MRGLDAHTEQQRADRLPQAADVRLAHNAQAIMQWR